MDYYTLLKIAAISLFIEIFFKENDLDVFSLKIVNRLIEIEIQFGNVERAIDWIHIKNIFLSILIDKNEKFNQEEEEQYFLQIDAFISAQILKTKAEDFKVMDKIIYELSDNALVSSEVMAKYVLGVYDTQLLKECDGDKKRVDKHIEEFYKASLQQKLPDPIYNDGKKAIIYSMLNVNKMEINYTATKLISRFA